MRTEETRGEPPITTLHRLDDGNVFGNQPRRIPLLSCPDTHENQSVRLRDKLDNLVPHPSVRRTHRHRDMKQAVVLDEFRALGVECPECAERPQGLIAAMLRAIECAGRLKNLSKAEDV